MTDTIFIKCGISIIKVQKKSATKSKILKDNILNNPNLINTYENPFIIEEAYGDSLDFIISYLNYNNDEPETEAPEAPLKKLDISTIFGPEYKIFSSLYNKTDPLEHNVMKLNNLISSSVYFGLEHLTKKLCCIMADMLRNKSYLEINSIL